MIDAFILDDNGNPIPVPIEQWSRWFSVADRDVARTEWGGLTVSTVFLGLDHNYSHEGPPLLYETMISRADGTFLDYQERYATREEALLGHTRACDTRLGDYGEGAS